MGLSHRVEISPTLVIVVDNLLTSYENIMFIEQFCSVGMKSALTFVNGGVLSVYNWSQIVPIIHPDGSGNF